MSKLFTGGYQPTNRPENLITPNRGPAYRPNKELKMIELVVGSRFIYKGELCEVVKDSELGNSCALCVFKYGGKRCRKMKCTSTFRSDCNFVHFERVKE